MFSATKTPSCSYGIQQLHHEHLRSTATSIRNISHLPSPSPAIFLTNVIHDSDPSTFCLHPTSASKLILRITSCRYSFGHVRSTCSLKRRSASYLPAPPLGHPGEDMRGCGRSSSCVAASAGVSLVSAFERVLRICSS